MESENKVVRALGFEFGGTGVKIGIGEKIFKNNEIKEAKILDWQNFKTGESDPQEVLNNLLDWSKKYEYEEIGIASFGPLCLDEKKAEYGNITNTPKKQWQHFPLLRTIKEIFKPKQNVFAMDTDVNSCATAEFFLGGHNVKESLAYITIGTGVGVGLVINGKTVHGLQHPEGGHQRLEILPADKDFVGVCPFHGCCAEGLITNHAIAKRKQTTIDKLSEIADDDPIWQLIGNYIAQVCVNIIFLCSPEVIIIGGGVMNRNILYDIARKEFKKIINGYLEYETPEQPYICEPKYKDLVGLIGGITLINLK